LKYIRGFEPLKLPILSDILDFDNLAPSGELSCKLKALTSMPGQDKQCLSPTRFS